MFKITTPKDLDWLFFLRVYMEPEIYRPTGKKSGNRLKAYFKLFGKIGVSFFRQRPKMKDTGSFFFLDNSRHVEQAAYIIPQLSQVFCYKGTDSNYNAEFEKGLNWSYKFLMKYFFYFLKREIKKDSTIYNASLPYSFYGLLHFEFFKRFLKHNNFNYVVLFTDHSYKNRALLFAAKNLGITTCYVPHASVYGSFPPLEFDIAFLEGEDMVRKYQKIQKQWAFPENTEIIKTGNIKLNAYRKTSDTEKIKKTYTIGLAYNLLDSHSKVEKWRKMLNQMDGLRDYTVVLRPHPSLISKNGRKNDKNFSNPYFESSMDFLNRVDFLLSGNSNIILESLLLHKPAAIVAIQKEEFHDTYSFVENGLCSFLETKSDFKEFFEKGYNELKKKRDKLTYYDYSYSKPLNSADIVVGRLKKIPSHC